MAQNDYPNSVGAIRDTQKRKPIQPHTAMFCSYFGKARRHLKRSFNFSIKLFSEIVGKFGT